MNNNTIRQDKTKLTRIGQKGEDKSKRKTTKNKYRDKDTLVHTESHKNTNL